MTDLLHNIIQRDGHMVDDLITAGFEAITPERLERAVNEDRDILALALDHFSLGNPYVAPLAKTVLKDWWDLVDKYLSHPDVLYEIISRNPKSKAILDRPGGIEYLNRQCAIGYSRLYRYVWQGMPYTELQQSL